MKKIILCLFLLSISLLAGCSAEYTGSTPVEIKKEIIETNEEIYKVSAVDWLFGNWVKMCNKDGCKTFDLYKTGLRSSIGNNDIIKVTTLKIKKGQREWTETEFEYVEE